MMRNRLQNTSVPYMGSLLVAVMLLCSVITPARAIPLFARKYKTTCYTCHVSVPMLNEFGKRFQANGYRIANSEPKTPTWDQLPIVLAFAVTPEVIYAHTRDNITNEVTDSRNFSKAKGRWQLKSLVNTGPKLSLKRYLL